MLWRRIPKYNYGDFMQEIFREIMSMEKTQEKSAWEKPWRN